MKIRYERHNLKVRAEDGDDTPVTAALLNRTINAAIANLIRSDLPKMVSDSNKNLNDQMTQVLAAIQNSGTQAPPQPTTAPTPTAPHDSNVLPPAIQAQLLEMKRQNDALATQLKGLNEKSAAAESKAEAAERETAIRKAMSPYKFTSDQAAEAAYRLLALEVKRNENGELIAGENLPVDAFVKDSLTNKHDYFLAGKEISGAGASKGTSRSNSGVGIESINSRMSESDRASVEEQIKNAWLQATQL